MTERTNIENHGESPRQAGACPEGVPGDAPELDHRDASATPEATSGDAAPIGTRDHRVYTDATRLRFDQHDRWHTSAALHTSSVYNDRLCCYCARPVRADAVRLRTARTNDGEWWLIGPDIDLTTDEWRDFQTNGGRAPTPTLLPVGPDCLRQHQEWQFAVVSAP